MGMAVETKPWHRDDLARLPKDGNRYEVLGGRLLLTPQASLHHQFVADRFILVLNTYLEQHRLGRAVGPGAVFLGTDEELQPDVQVIPGPLPARWEDCPTPTLVVEVLSRSNRRYDLGRKRAAYLDRVGIPVVWLADHHRREMHVCEAGAPIRIERELLEWHPAGAPAPLRIDVQALFTAALGAE